MDSVPLGTDFFGIIGIMSVWRLPKIQRMVDRGLRQIDVSE